MAVTAFGSKANSATGRAEGSAGGKEWRRPFRPSRSHFRLMGALLRPPELRFLGEKNTPVLFLPLGASTPGKGTWFLGVRLWGTQAEELADTVAVGQVLYAEGEMVWHKPPEGRGRVHLEARLLRALTGEYPLTAPDRKGQRRLQGGINEVWLMGSLASEVRRLRAENGTEGAAFSLAVPGVGGFYDVALWGEVAAAFLRLEPKRKDQLLLKGFLLNKVYTDKSGKEVWALEVRGEEVHLLEPPSRGSNERDNERGAYRTLTEYDLPEEELPF